MVAMHEALQSIVKYFNPSKATHVDDLKINAVQYKGVFGALLACGILSGLTSWFSRIECIRPDFANVDLAYVEEWCYANSSFVIRDPHGLSGIGNPYASPFNKTVHLRHYQWVTIVLFLQAAGFQIPRLLWKRLEGGRVRRMVNQVKDLDFASREQRSQGVRQLVEHFLSPHRAQVDQNYFNYFAIYQFLYLINATLQIIFTHAFLDKQFLQYFPVWLKNSAELNLVFPKHVKCAIELYSAAGKLQQVDVLCVLAMNVLFEKIYLFVWVMFMCAFGAALLQIGLTLIWASSPADSESVKQIPFRSKSDRLLLKFLKKSLDRSVYEEFRAHLIPPPLDEHV